MSKILNFNKVSNMHSHGIICHHQPTGLLACLVVSLSLFAGVSLVLCPTLLHADQHERGGGRYEREQGHDPEYI
jgi:hypothetical protein